MVFHLRCALRFFLGTLRHLLITPAIFSLCIYSVSLFSTFPHVYPRFPALSFIFHFFSSYPQAKIIGTLHRSFYSSCVLHIPFFCCAMRPSANNSVFKRLSPRQMHRSAAFSHFSPLFSLLLHTLYRTLITLPFHVCTTGVRCTIIALYAALCQLSPLYLSPWIYSAIYQWTRSARLQRTYRATISERFLASPRLLLRCHMYVTSLPPPMSDHFFFILPTRLNQARGPEFMP